ncbi:MAG: hypothetical protein OQK09_07950 [Colwellia sp.]|nr:hypothetical protein [Colwellia sp.]MCW8865925.1 hypothetical protein [Colwellia sp.]MCW9081431.1 hypothetical protein [Colwellia sp.]
MTEPEPELVQNRAPSQSSIANSQAVEAEAFSTALIASDADGDPLTFSKVSGASWLSVVGGNLVGTPTLADIGTSSVVIAVSDGKASTESTLTVTVTAAEIINNAPSQITMASQNAIESVEFNQVLLATDADSDSLTFSKVSGATWLNVVDGALVGTPTIDDIGTSSVVIAVTDGKDSTETTLTVIVSPAEVLETNSAPTVPSIANNSVIEWQEFSEQLLATDADGDTLTFSKVSGAEWLNVVGGNLVGTPTTDDIGTSSVVIAVTDGIETKQASITITVATSNTDKVVNDWAFSGSEAVSIVAAAQVSGDYAVASNQLIEIRDIRQSLLNSISAADIQALLPEVNLSTDSRICSMSFTASGRMLYMGICTSGSDTDKDAILAYNTNTEQLSVFDRLTISTDENNVTNYGMTFFKGELFVGTANGLYRYDASRNAVADNNADEPIGSIVATDGAVTGLAVDMIAQKLYVSSESTLYSAAINNNLVLEAVLSASNISGITFARTYGGSETAGLYFLQSDDAKTSLSMIKTADLNNNLSNTTSYSDFSADLTSISATADGKMLLANSNAQLMHDITDTRMNFDDWLKDELSQYVAAIKSLTVSGNISGTNTLPEMLEGFIARKVVAADQNPSTSPIADNVGWAIFLLMAADQVTPDPDIETLIELLVQRHAGLHPDGFGGVKTVDGHFVRNYQTNGIPSVTNDQPQVYISMKFIPAVYKAAQLYPDNANIKAYKEYLRQTMKRASDTIRAEQRITWTNDRHGPIETNNKMTNETWLYGDIGAAQDPLATQDYAEYVYSRTKMDYDTNLAKGALIGEPTIKSSHSAFIVMGGSMILRHHFEDPDWNEQNRNYYALTRAAGDDLGAPYFAAFSAGNNPGQNGNYYNDGPGDHPNNMLHFPAVKGLGQLGFTAPVVGAYMAYRDGLRQEMLNTSTAPNFSMLTRWSLDIPDYVMPSVGIADFWYGALGLVETIQPGVLDLLRDEFYLPELEVTTSSDGNVKLHYSKITPRRVIGNDGLGNETSFGFQLSPFEFAAGESFADYRAEDPEGEFIELNDKSSVPDGGVARFSNPNFEDGLTGWEQTNNSSTISVIANTNSIVGRSAMITTDASTLAAESIISQTLNVALDLENTRYIIRANGSLITTGSTGNAVLRVEWDDDADATNGIIGVSLDSNSLNDVDNRVEFVNRVTKPATANYAHLSFVVNAIEAQEQQYVFDDLSVVRLGADAAMSNGDFEAGMTDWTTSDSQISLTTAPSEVIDGTSSLKFSIGPGLTAWKKVTREMNVATDPDGTRYIFRLETKLISMLDSNFEVMIEVYDDSDEKIITRNDVGDITANTGDETVFTFRKRPNDAYYIITFRMKRNSNASTGTDEIIIDNLRLDKEQLF